jgi:uncharacterized protein YjiS (DUF1127 family)
MAAAHQIATPKAAISALPLAWFDELKTKLAQYRLYRQTFNELCGLSNRELADLGMNRSIIKRVAYQTAYENS